MKAQYPMGSRRETAGRDFTFDRIKTQSIDSANNDFFVRLQQTSLSCIPSLGVCFREIAMIENNSYFVIISILFIF